ncbi:MAG: transcriptional regulator, Crp/Fnr family, partial [Bryobacterales bacterium]|nr:transcriptional regulator, Crp/Fnr family [Bryobacterales bacterium]
IYGSEAPTCRVYLILIGKVKISRAGAGQSQILLDVYQADEFFGESCIVGSVTNEMATALEPVRVMSWPATQIRELALRNPELGFSMLQLLARKAVEAADRVESFAVDNSERRTIEALIRLATKLGKPTQSGGKEMIALTHQEIAEYVGTSRESVTQYMHAFRRKGLLDYSRKNIVVFEDALRDLVATEDVV